MNGSSEPTLKTLDALLPDDSRIAIIRFSKDWDYWSHEEMKGKDLKAAIRSEIAAQIAQHLSGGR